MQLLPILTAVAEQSIPGRPATWQESLRLMGAGWGSIFIVILVIMLCVYLLNRQRAAYDWKRFLRKSSKGMVAVLQGSQLAGQGILPLGGQRLPVLHRTQGNA